MTFILLKLIRAYQAFTRSGVTTPLFFGMYSGCRSWPTCSEYAHHEVTRAGVVVGGARALNRLIHCHSFFKTTHITP